MDLVFKEIKGSPVEEPPVNEWIRQELATADLGDKRLLKRMKLILKRLTESSKESIKSAFKGWAEVVGAYRFFDNEKTSVAGILKPHQDATLERVKEFKRVLVVQDTTELDYTTKKKLEGKGPLSTTDRQGFFAHNQLIITPERLTLGVWNTQIYARDEAEHGKSADRKQKPIEEKESYRWLEGYRDACDLAQLAPGVEVIACGDRENDIYEVFQEWHQRRANGQPAAEWLIRCNQDRRLESEATAQEGESEATAQEGEEEFPYRTIREKVEASELLGTFTLRVKAKEQSKKVKGNRVKTKRSARFAEMELRTTEVTLRPPYRKGKKLPKVSVFVVMVKEKDPPKGEDPIDWVLLTSLKVKGFQEALDVVDLYAVRWEIEVFHRVLKTGCTVEELQLKKDERTMVAIALYMIVAWRVLYVMMLGRECPDLPCDVVFEDDEWQGFWVIVHDGHPDALAEKPSLGEFVNKVAAFGGFLERKGDGHPGPQAIWQGLTKVGHFALAWKVYVKQEGYRAHKNTR